MRELLSLSIILCILLCFNCGAQNNFGKPQHALITKASYPKAYDQGIYNSCMPTTVVRLIWLQTGVYYDVDDLWFYSRLYSGRHNQNVGVNLDSIEFSINNFGLIKENLRDVSDYRKASQPFLKRDYLKVRLSVISMEDARNMVYKGVGVVFTPVGDGQFVKQIVSGSHAALVTEIIRNDVYILNSYNQTNSEIVKGKLDNSGRIVIDYFFILEIVS